MFRIILFFGVLTAFNFFSSDVSITLNMPTSANAGEEFLVEVTINKGNIEGFARFEQSLPVGFTAVARKTANGNFRFENQKVKIQWMQVPFDQEIVISYAIQVGPTVSGNFKFGGKFSYVLNNSVQTASATSKSITIIGDETLAGTATDATTTISYQNVSLKDVDCIRQKPYLNDNNEIIVNLLINKGDLTGFGKIQEQIPVGYKAESLRSKNSIFTFKNSIIKFLWMNMPADPQFVVSYKLVPEGNIPDDEAFIITGTFSYAENERSKTINIADRNVDLDNFKGDQLVVTTTKPKEQEETATPQETTTKASSVITQPEKTTTNKIADNIQPERQTSSGNLSDITYTPSPDRNGVAYRVQIAAGHNLVSEKYFKKLNITDEVQIEIHQGWHKYTVGNFPIYKDARDYRMYIWNNTPIHDAFVAAYNNGMRITVQEALMIANQKWYK
jgi:hypothetical protein